MLLTDRRFWLGVVAAAGVVFAVWVITGKLDEAPDVDRDVSSDSSEQETAEPSGLPAEDNGAIADKGDVRKAGEDKKPWYPDADIEPTVTDVQHWDWLQQDLNLLIDRARPKARKRLGADEFKKEYLSASIGYLQLEGEELKRFETATQRSLATIEKARTRMEETKARTPYDEENPDAAQKWKDAQAEFLSEQKKAAELLVKEIPVRPRATLMREQALTWIIRYDFGIRHAKRRGRY